MYKQLITIVVLIISISAQAQTSAELTEINNQFKKNYTYLLEKKFTKADFNKIFNDLDKKLNSQYEDFATKEKGQLTEDGNQMALDLEMLEPLRILSNGQLSVEACNQALHNNEMNAVANQATTEKIRLLIIGLCSK